MWSPVCISGLPSANESAKRVFGAVTVSPSFMFPSMLASDSWDEFGVIKKRLPWLHIDAGRSRAMSIDLKVAPDGRVSVGLRVAQAAAMRREASMAMARTTPTITVFVEVPAGLHAGHEMLVTFHQREHLVVVPPGCAAGDTLELTLPEPAPEGFVNLELPPDCLPGTQMQVDIGDEGSALTFTVPLDCAAGSSVRVELPHEPKGSTDLLHSESSPARSHHAYPIGADTPQTVHPSRRRGSTDPLAGPPQSEFWIGLEVEVLRTDGRRTFGVVEYVDELSCTYTVRLHDGLVKHMVEEEDLRHLIAGQYRTGDAVSVRSALGGSRREREGRIAGYDDDDGTYSVIFSGGEVVMNLKRTSITRQQAARPAMD